MRLRRSFLVILVALAGAALVFTGCAGEKSEERGPSGEDTTRAEVTSPERGGEQQPDTLSAATAEVPNAHVQDSQPGSLPRLLDLGKGTCIPCKMMAPILEELKREYRGKAVVEVIDLRDDPGAAREYGIRVIPTQIFYDAGGEEVWRHEGFLGKDAITAKFTEMGVEAP